MKRITLFITSLLLISISAMAQTFKVSDAPDENGWAANTTWYFIQHYDGYLVSTSNADADGYLKLNNKFLTTDETGYWCIVGNETDGYMFYNKDAGTSKVLYSKRTLNHNLASFCMTSTIAGDNIKFDIAEHGNIGYYAIKDHNNQNNYWNLRDESYLAYWNNTSAIVAGTGNGSSFKLIEANEYNDYIYNPNYLPKTNENTAREVRYVAFTSSYWGEQIYTLTDSERSNTFLNLTKSVTFKVCPGETITITTCNSGDNSESTANGHHWLNAYVYIDKDKNGFTAGIAENGYSPTEDLVSYSHYSGDDNEDENGNGKNSAGEAITGANRNTVVLPSFTVPTEEGDYRMRIKYDWNSLDPRGDTNATDGDFNGNVGRIVDVILKVYDPYVRNIEDFSNNIIYTIECTKGFLMSKADNDKVVSSVKNNLTGGKDYPDSHWAIYRSDLGNYYFYNIGAGKFIGYADGANARLPLVDKPNIPNGMKFKYSNFETEYKIMFSPNDKGAININNDGVFGNEGVALWQASVGSGDGWEKLDDAGQSFRIEKIGTVADEVLADIESKVQAYENSSVYIIKSAHDGYAAGSAIYYDGTWKWKTANKYDKQMWIVFDGYTNQELPVVDAYNPDGVFYTLTNFEGNAVMRDKQVQVVKIEGWENTYNLQYGTTQDDQVQHAQNTKNLVGWNPATTSACKASAWNLEYLGTTGELRRLTDDHLTARDNLLQVYNSNLPYANDNYMGTQFWQFSDNNRIKTAVNSANEILNKSLVELSYMAIDDITATTEELTVAVDDAVNAINSRLAGRFYRIKNNEGSAHLVSGTSGRTQFAANTAASVNSIFYFTGDKLLQYENGIYVSKSSAAKPFLDYTATVGESAAVSIAFAPCPVATERVNIIFNGDRYLYSSAAGGSNAGENASHSTDAAYRFTLEEVQWLPVPVSVEAGWATLYSPVALSTYKYGSTTEHRVEAYTGVVSEGGEALTLSRVDAEDGIIPANTPVILKYLSDAENGFVFLAVKYDNEKEAVESSLRGTIADTHIAESAYVLGKPAEKEIGLYPAELNVSTGANGTEYDAFLNNSNKVYLPASLVPEGVQGSNSFSFRFDDGFTTGVENADVDNAPDVIYTIGGTRVKAAVLPGLYIVNGKKVYVK